MKYWSYIVQVSLELELFLPHSPECWDYRNVPLCLGYNNLFLQNENDHMPSTSMSRRGKTLSLNKLCDAVWVIVFDNLLGTECPCARMSRTATYISQDHLFLFSSLWKLVQGEGHHSIFWSMKDLDF